ncbi:MAG: hypothetical protein JEZ09_03880 [Salinivirgaceae bacterium]|nr:hypothetical protein [Salinivirgaceae bacterium]
MEKNTVIEILEALASGYSPTTGEELEKDNVLNERNVIRALQIAINELKLNSYTNRKEIQISEEDIRNSIEVFKQSKINLTPNRLTNFLLGVKKFKQEEINKNELYGKYKFIKTKGFLTDHLTEFLNEFYPSTKKERNEDPWSNIDFFQQQTFNKLSENAINQLKQKVSELEITKVENLSEYIQKARIQYPRAYEPWSDKEKELLNKALDFTNDIDLLTSCFLRGKGAIESYGKRLLYERQIC